VRDREFNGTEGHQRAGLRASLLSILWTGASSTAAVVLGLRSHSLVLAAFGGTGLLDAAGSVALVAHFRSALARRGSSDRLERVALRVVVTGLIVVGVLTGSESIRYLIVRARVESDVAGLAIAGASVLVLGVLAHRKHHIAVAIPSHALRADSYLSGTGSLLALVTLAGTALASSFGWWWADPLSALCVALGAIGLSVIVLKSSRG
jgi:divalent metal cation (Fe/Co/Zn/Cd) transporter